MDLSYNVQYNKLHDTSTTNNCTTTVLDTSNFYYNKNELEILGRAQDEVARRCKFDRGDNLMGWNSTRSNATWRAIQRLLWSCLLWCTKQEMTPNYIHDNQTMHLFRWNPVKQKL